MNIFSISAKFAQSLGSIGGLVCALMLLLGGTGASASDPVLLNGAGATFPYPLYSKWFSEFKKVDPSTEINYQSIGSGGGVRQLLDGTVDFGASDAPMTPEQTAKAKGPILHIPTVLGGVVVTYNVPGVSSGLKLSGDALADIFLGKITQWNDERISKVNPGVKLPAAPIMVVHRSDGSGTTAIFTDYLAKVSPEWKEKVGSGTALKWPAGLGGKGNEGVSGIVKNTPGTLGYVEFVYAETNKMPVASLKNQSGAFVAPSVRSFSAAAAGAMKSMPDDFKISLTQAAGKDSYPISGFTYILVPQKLTSPKGQKLVAFLKWAMQAGQKLAEPLAYAPLPKAMVGKVENKISEIRVE